MGRTVLLLFFFLLVRSSMLASILVGRTEGVFTVSPSGAGTYQIPIKVQPGLSSFVPTISLCYNSQGGNGIAGYGWSLAGFSSISITSRCVYFDGQAEAIYRGEDNAFTLDGMRLLHKSGTNGQVGATYCTEYDQGNLIEITSCASGTPETFTVKTTEGHTCKYGSSSGRKMTDNGETYEWALDYAEDVLGNYISYEYGQEGILYPVSITYGKNARGNNGVLCRIIFDYEKRPDSVFSYLLGESHSFTQRLARVTCKYADYTYRAYDLDYSEGTFSHLVSVTESGTGSSSYRPTTFAWNSLPGIQFSSAPKAMETGLSSNTDDEYYFSGDVDGDGLSEVISMGYRIVGGRPYIYFEGRKWNAREQRFTYCMSGDTQSGIVPEGMEGLFQSIHDGGVCMHASQKVGNSVVFPYLDIQDGAAYMQFHFIRERQTLNYPMASSSREIPAYTILDADRDGLDEILMVEKSKVNGTYPAHLVKCNLTSGKLTYEATSFNLEGIPDKIVCADYNKDGMLDLLVSTSAGHYIYWNRTGHFSDADRYHGTDFGKCDILRVGDFNGDGLPDLLIRKGNSPEWYIARNRGREEDGYFAMQAVDYLNSLGTTHTQGNNLYCLLQDLDGDGRSDAIIGYSQHSGSRFVNGHIYVLRSDGNGLDFHSSYEFKDERDFPKASHIIQGDFDGHGSVELLFMGRGLGEKQEARGWYLAMNPLLGVSTNKIVTITDGLDATDSIGYGMLSDEGVYEVNSSHAFPLVRCPESVPVVVSRTESIPGDSRTTLYQYENGLYHIQGKGFLGFEDQRSASSTGTATATHSTLDSTFYILSLQSVTTSDDNGIPIRREDYKAHYNKAGPRAYKLLQNFRQSREPLSGFACAEDYQYYENGCPTRVVLSDDLFTTEKDITYWESPQKEVWIKGLPKRIDIVHSASQPGADDVHESILYERDSATGLVLKETRKRNGLLVSTNGYSYNEYGQVTEHYSIAYNSTDTLLTRYTYTSKGQVRTETSPLGLMRVYLYSTQHGSLSSVIDPASFRTVYSYDGMLRRTLERTPIGDSRISLNFRSYGNGVYCVTERLMDQPAVMTFYDAWGRKVSEARVSAIGDYKYRDYCYLPNGELGFASFPHGRTETGTAGTTYCYDKAHRLISAIDSNGKTSTWSYGLTQVTSNIDGVGQTTYYYTPELVSTIEDESGYADYEYNTDGNVTTIYTESAQADYAYDAYGRLTRVVDMNGVARDYTYDRNGYPRSKRLGDSSRETEYDKNGILRSITRIDPGNSPHTTRYSYDAKWRLSKEEGNDHVYSYSYDEYGRLASKSFSTRERPEVCLSTRLTYGDGHLVTHKTSCFTGVDAPITETIEYRNTWPVSRWLNDSLVWHLEKQDHWENPTRVSDHLAVTTRTFDDYGHMLSLDRNGRAPLHESYTYDIRTGNMLSKNGRSLLYDSMGRLKEWDGQELSYDSKGNITAMPSVGNYTYQGYRLTSTEITNLELDVDDSLRVSYLNSIERPNRIENSRYRADFLYDADGNRLLMKVYRKQGGTHFPYFTRYYLGDNAEVTKEENDFCNYLYYAGDDCYTAPAVLHLNEDGYGSICQIARDNLGSALQYEDKYGSPSRNYFSPWGVRRHGGDGGSLYSPGERPALGYFHRTFTGHEDLWMFGLINANARLYDPYSGRFLSPDPLLNSEGGPLLYNPYVYANNNPCRYIDRNGEFWWIALAAVLAGGFNVMKNIDDISSAGDFFKYFGIGAVAGAAGAAAAPCVVSALGLSSAGFLSGAVGGAVSGAVSNLIQSGMNYVFLGASHPFDGMDFAIQTAVSSAIGGIGGGIQAKVKGYNFWTGKPNALETLSGKIQTTIAGYGEKEIGPRPTSHELGEIGEMQAVSEMETEGIEVVGRHFAYRVEGVEGYGFTDVVGRDGKMIFIFEAKNGKYARPTPYQKKAFPYMKEKANIRFFGPKAARYLLPQEPFNDYIFDIKRYNIP